MTTAKHNPDFGFPNDTPYLAFPGELWGVYCEYFGENLPPYNGIALYSLGTLLCFVVFNYPLSLPISSKVTSLALSLQCRHNERTCVSIHKCLDCLLHCLFRCKSKKISKFRVTGLCEGNPPVTGGFHSQRAVTRKKFSFDDVIMVESYDWIPWQCSKPEEYGNTHTTIRNL